MAKVKVDAQMAKQERQWQVEDAMRTLQRAEQIRNDKALMNDVKRSMVNLQKMVMGGPIKAAPAKKPTVQRTLKRK